MRFRGGGCRWWRHWRGSGVMAKAPAANRLARGGSAIMPASDLINLSGLMNDAKCFASMHHDRWPEGVCCPSCDSSLVIRDGCNDTQSSRQRYQCKACASRLDDLTGTVLAGHHQPPRVCVLCLPFMGLNLSNWQIAGELGTAVSDVQAMTLQLRAGLLAKVPAADLTGEVKPDTRVFSGIDEVYVWPGIRDSRRLLPNGAARAPSQAGRRARPRHAGEEQAADPWPDPARRASGDAHAGQRAAGHDRADHHCRGCPGYRCPHGRVLHLRLPASLGL